MSQLLPLFVPKLDLQRASDPGEPPRLEWLPVKHLFIDPQYQRTITPRGHATIARIAAEFSWARFAPVIVAKAGEGEVYSIIDGQHRTIAARARGHLAVPCSIVSAGTKEQARIFAAVNGNVTPVGPVQLFKAARAAGEDWALAIDRVCAAAGLRALGYQLAKSGMKPYQTIAIGTLRKYIARFGEADVAAALKAEATKPGSDTPGYFNSIVIAGAVDSWRESAGQKRVIAPADMTSIAQRIRDLKAKGHSRFAIQAALNVKLTDIEAALAESAA